MTWRLHNEVAFWVSVIVMIYADEQCTSDGSDLRARLSRFFEFRKFMLRLDAIDAREVYP